MQTIQLADIDKGTLFLLLAITVHKDNKGLPIILTDYSTQLHLEKGNIYISEDEFCVDDYLRFEVDDELSNRSIIRDSYEVMMDDLIYGETFSLAGLKKAISTYVMCLQCRMGRWEALSMSW